MFNFISRFAFFTIQIGQENAKLYRQYMNEVILWI